MTTITFARLKILHTSIIENLLKILVKDNLPLAISYSNVASYFDIIELATFQSQTKKLFFLLNPLVEPENYILFRLFTIPILDDRTGLHRIILANQEYIEHSTQKLVPKLFHCPSIAMQFGKHSYYHILCKFQRHTVPL